ncbi:MAG TPA: TraB/GumN family protein [Candidatus Thermoplasmatota archaeon]|nr:TraB/GumN family protein [Candidatus Thermoplasmatota archaeon]
MLNLFPWPAACPSRTVMTRTSVPGALITLIGTGHVFDIGARVRDEIRRREPQVVGIELDPPRFHALRTRNKDKKGLPLAYRVLAGFQTRVANEYGVEAGDEMLAASEEARALGVPLALIDADAQQTFAKLRREMRFFEKVKLLGALAAGLVLPGKSVDKQIDEMQDDYASYFEEMGRRFPTVKRVLLDERNEHMAAQLVRLAGTQERVVAVVGDGHVDGIRDILVAKGLPVETVRLKQLRAKDPPPVGTATATVGFDLPGDAPPPRP